MSSARVPPVPFTPVAPFERDTLLRIFLHPVAAFPGAPALQSRHDGRWVSISYAEAAERVARLAAALKARGVGEGDRVAILSENRPEWALADYAVLSLGAVSVPLYPTLPASQLVHILNDSGARLVFVSTPAQGQKLASVRGELPHLERIVGFDFADADAGIESFADLVGSGAGASVDALRERAAAVSPERAATLIYTSGTTGTPKGVILSHGNLAYMVAATRQHGSLPLAPGDVAMSLLPLSHVFERAVDYYYWDEGVTIAYAESFERFASNLGDVRPHVMVAVPRVFEKVYERVTGAAGAKGRIARWAAEVGRQKVEAELAGRAPSVAVRLQHAVADRLVFAKVRQALGGRMRIFISGGAPLRGEVAAFFFAAGVRVHEGYGLTETSPVLAANRPGETRLGTVGVPYPGVEMRIAEAGEILARSPGVMRGYWNDPVATAKTVDDDGWFRTGDVGEFDADGFLRITDRLKDLIVTAGGKNVAPQPIESHAAVSRYVAQAVLVGDRRPYPVLLVVPDFEQLGAWAAEQGIHTDRADLLRHPRVVELFEGETLRCMQPFARYEQPRRLALIPDEMTLESGLLTPTLKVRRRAVEQRYADLIEALYSAGRAGA